MKQVVINGGETHGGLLTPKWTVEYYKRKGIELYVYIDEFIEEDNDYITVLKDSNTLDNNTEIYCPIYLTKNFGDIIKIDDTMNESIIYEHDMFKDREDKILIDIVKEIDNEKLIKIVDIPNDVEYNVVQSDCGFREYVEEKHRIWG